MNEALLIILFFLVLCIWLGLRYWNALKKERSWRICKSKNLSNQPV